MASRIGKFLGDDGGGRRRRPRRGDGTATARADFPIVRPAEAAVAGAAEATDVAVANPLATVLTQRLLRDGEIVLLTLKPSLLFIPFSGLRFCAVVLMLMIAAKLAENQLPYHVRTYVEIGAFVLTARVIWAVMQWMSRLYLLTDQRIITITGVFNVEIFSCPLRKVARTRVVYTLKERVLGLGSIEIIPLDESYPISLWQTVARVRQVHRKVMTTIARAKQGGCL